MKDAQLYFSLLAKMISKYNLGLMPRMNRDKIGYRESKVYSNKNNFKRNQRSGL